MATWRTSRRWEADYHTPEIDVILSHAAAGLNDRASWDGQVLRVVTRYPGIDPSNGKPFTTEVTTLVSLRSPTELLVESTRAGVLGGQPTSGRTVYRKNP